jgi:hypothetical protein
MQRTTRWGFLAALALGSLGTLHGWPAQAQSAIEWRTFESSAGKFKAAFPAAPTMKRGRLRTEIGEIVSTRHSADSADATYDLTYNDYPRDAIARASAAKLVDAARDGLVYQSKGELVSEKPFTLGNRAGREIEISGADGMRYRIRLLLVENRLYQLTAMAKPPARPEEQKFFSSFQLLRESP